MASRSSTYTGPHFSEGVEDAVENDEEGEDGEDLVQGAADDESENRPQDEAQRHGLLAANLVHEEAANQSPRDVEQVEHGAVANILHQRVVGVERRNDG